MRRSIKSFFAYSALTWFITLIMYIVGNSSEYKWLSLAAMVLGFGLMLYSVMMFAFLNNSGLTKDWFKTRDELLLAKENLDEEWEQAHRVRTIIGNHEAVKYYEQKIGDAEYTERRRERYLKLKKEFAPDVPMEDVETVIRTEQDYWLEKTGSKTSTEIVAHCIRLGFDMQKGGYNIPYIRKIQENRS